MKVLAKIVLGVVGFVLVALFTLVVTGVAVGTANAWILEAPFSAGWSAVWDRWWQSLAWAWIFAGSGGVAVNSR